ncbi:MAPK kinase substrate protein At1g80180 [Linum grandiflorum]
MELGGLQRSATSYRRQGSSGLIWDDKLIAEFCNQAEAEKAAAAAAAVGGGGDPPLTTPDPLSDTTNRQPKADTVSSEAGKMRRSHSAGSRGYRALKVASSPNVDPPSPKVSTCAFCGLFAKPSPSADGRRRRRQQQPQKQMKKTSKRT